MIGIDLGASSGRVMLGQVADDVLTMRQVHRFHHAIAERDGIKRWDWPSIRRDVRRGLAVACQVAAQGSIQSIACSAWAQDFGLLDASGELLFPPVSYRDDRTMGMPDRIADIIPPAALHSRTGSGIQSVTTLCQLRAMAEREPQALRAARQLLWIADLVHYDLCAELATDWTLATASQLRNVESGRWDEELLARLDIPSGILPPITMDPGVIGAVGADDAPHPRLAAMPVVNGVGHDTAAATAVLAPLERGTLFLSLGTWAMMGVCTDTFPIRAERPDTSLTALGLAFGKWGLFHGGMGLWLLEECRRVWAVQGQEVAIEELIQAVDNADISSVVNVNDDRFFAPADMPNEIAMACRETGQRPPGTPPEYAKVVLDSLAEGFSKSMARLAEATGFGFDAVRVIGGGSRNAYLCRRIARVSGIPVIAGPAEATAAGIMLTQAQALGLVDRHSIARVASRSFRLARYDGGD